jgi:hypothetical protein
MYQLVLVTRAFNQANIPSVCFQIVLIRAKNNYFTYDYSPTTGKYDQLVTLSNSFDQTIITHRPNLKLSYNAKSIIV